MRKDALFATVTALGFAFGAPIATLAQTSPAPSFPSSHPPATANAPAPDDVKTTTNQGKPMHWRRLYEDWRAHAPILKQRWDRLTDTDLDNINGQRPRLVGVLQTRYGITAAQAEQQVVEFERRAR
jgi:uncharacterized protein YjbJ (UPF0337 family)